MAKIASRTPRNRNQDRAIAMKTDKNHRADGPPRESLSRGGPPDMATIKETLKTVRKALAKSLTEQRETKELSQAEIARRIGSSQPRVAKLEAVDKGGSLDLYFRALLATGITVQRIGSEITLIPKPGSRPKRLRGSFPELARRISEFHLQRKKT